MSDTITVAELRETLSRFPDDAEVRVASHTGDHWKTVLANPIEDADWAYITDCPRYGDRAKKVADEYADHFDRDECAEVVLLGEI